MQVTQVTIHVNIIVPRRPHHKFSGAESLHMDINSCHRGMEPGIIHTSNLEQHSKDMVLNSPDRRASRS